VPSGESGHFLRAYFDQKIIAYNTIARISWIEGHQERALKEVDDNIQRATDLGHHLSMASVLAECGCPVAFLSGDLDLCERYTADLREESAPRTLDVWNTFAECFDAAKSKPVSTGYAPESRSCAAPISWSTTKRSS
jgi:hypothetical protein